jgi:hypothetical protein
MPKQAPLNARDPRDRDYPAHGPRPQVAITLFVLAFPQSVQAVAARSRSHSARPDRNQAGEMYDR